MKRNLAIVALCLSVVFGPTLAQQAHPSVADLSPAEKVKKKPQNYAQTKASTAIWGADASIGTADGEFQNGFVNSSTTFDPSSWTSYTVSDNNGAPGAAYWAHTLAGAGQGLFWNAAAPIASPTQANGSAIFDSDYLDNGGVALGSGTSPGAHEGWLVSPRIDLTGYTDTLMQARFFCKWRNFGVSDFTISMSTDDGVTWEEVNIASLLVSAPNEENEGWVKAIFPTASLGVTNMTQCRFRFRFNGYYYYAIVDDLTIESVLSHDLAVGQNDPVSSFISDNSDQVHLMNNRYIPINGIEYPRDFTYGINVRNRGAKLYQASYGAEVRAIIEKDIAGVWTEVNRDSTSIPMLISLGSAFVTDTLDDASWVSVGDFRVTYDITATVESDFSNNTIQHFFTINDDTYASKVDVDANDLPLITNPVFPGGVSFQNFEIGSTFDFPDAGTSGIGLDSISQGFHIQTGYVGNGDIIYNLKVYEWTDNDNDGLLNESTELNLVALGVDTLVGVDNLIGNDITQSTRVKDLNSGQWGYNFTDDSVYFVSVSLNATDNGMTDFNSTSMVWVGCSDLNSYAMNYLYTGDKAHALILQDGAGVESLNDIAFGVTRVPSMGLHLGEACQPIAASYSFTDTFLDVDFTDASTPQVDTWTWDMGDGTTYTVQNPSHTYAAAGQYIVCLTATNVCSSDTICDTVEVAPNTSGLSLNWMEQVLVYPIPTEDVLQIDNVPMGAIQVQLRNLAGQIVFDGIFEENEKIIVPVNSFAAGHYNLTLQTDAGVLVKNVIVR
ncbi:MAG: hypothetical protein Crog4KO_12290 [Crocinitomicaceae bacterium]